ncbi:hypothetical protein F2P56_006923, partial [Juglans regia]
VKAQGKNIASLCWNESGETIFALTDHIPNVSSNLGETMASLMAISKAKRLGLKKIILEGDSSTTITAINNSADEDDWITSPIIKDIKHHLLSFEVWKVRKIHRSKNRCAHDLAQWAAATQAYKTSTATPTQQLHFAQPDSISPSQEKKNFFFVQQR